MPLHYIKLRLCTARTAAKENETKIKNRTSEDNLIHFNQPPAVDLNSFFLFPPLALTEIFMSAFSPAI